MRVLDQKSVLSGTYVQESLRPGARWLLDVGVRWDRVRFRVIGQEAIDFDYATGRYGEGRGAIDYEFSSAAVNPRIGAVFQAGRTVNLYAGVSTGTQTPTIGELAENPELGLTRVVSYEIGLKLRHPGLTLDAAAFHSPVWGEIVQVVEPHGTTGYANAGRTDKTGFEIAAAWRPLPGLSLGGSYAFSEFVFREFSEPAYGRDVDRSGNRLPFVPRHQYSVFAAYDHRSGLNLRVSADTWGRYFVDNANSAEHGGYVLATDLSLGYRLRRLEIGLIIQNLFDQRYAVEVQKDLYGTTRSSPAAPRRILARCAYRF
jgi:iron complex outermembrane receptor protein